MKITPPSGSILDGRQRTAITDPDPDPATAKRAFEAMMEITIESLPSRRPGAADAGLTLTYACPGFFRRIRGQISRSQIQSRAPVSNSQGRPTAKAVITAATALDRL